MAFDRHFAAAKFGKADWLKGKGSKESEIYGWVAKASDFNSDCPVGQQLKKKGELMTVDELSNGATRKKELLRAKLEEQIVEKDRDLEALKTKYSKENVLVDKMMEERTKRLESYNIEVQKLRNLALSHTRKVVEDNEKLRLQLENKCTELDTLVLETNKKKRTLEDEQALKSKKIALQNATLEQRKADENVMEAIKQQQKEKEAVTAKMLQLEKQLEVKQQLELEIEHLKGKVQIMTHMGSESDIEIKEKVFQLNKELREKIEEMEDLEALNQALVVKESSSRTELEQAHKELVTVLSEMTTTNSKIHVKVIDELNMMQELWRKSGGKATLNEALQFLIDTWKASRKH